jgi:hypothetical protein
MGCPWLAISGQRIFQQPFSWKSVGVDVRGRSYPLRIDYRTSYFAASTRRCGWQPESRHGTISVFNGVDRVIKTFADLDREVGPVGKWLADCIA